LASPNLDLVRSMYSASGRGDYSSADWAHPQMELVFVDGPSPGIWSGLAEVAQGWRSFLSTWEELSAEAEEFRELDDERILVLVRYHGRGKTSGVELQQMRARGAAVFHLREGKVAKQIVYFDRERAFADLGLPSEANHNRA
jgi:ketosteroid isomerase-like protein